MTTNEERINAITESLASHVMGVAGCSAWVLRKPYCKEDPIPWDESFTVVHIPHRLIVTGDVGDAIYTAHGFGSVKEAVSLVWGSGFDYLTGKSTHKKEYDPYATARHIVDDTYAELRARPLRTTVLLEYLCVGGGSAAERKRAIRSFLNEGISDDEAYDITSDSEMLCYSYQLPAHRTYLALKKWASIMVQD